ncbi:MAG TPA: hypothetical protein VHE30_01335 [Polyangiaceae bacterium]|nr:hypothetical protein [Polyangiaceae bacterium]
MSAAPSVFDLIERVATSGGYAKLAELLSRTERMVEGELALHQRRRFAAVVRHARETVPYYADLPALPEEPSPEDLLRIPILRRETVRDRAAELESTRFPKGHAVEREANSSGSTGRHVTVKVDSVAANVGHGVALRDSAWHGRDPRLKGATIRAVADGARAPEGRRLERWLAHAESGPGALLDVHTKPAEQLEWLLRENPAYLATYPSNAGALLEEAERRRVSWPALRELGTFGEVLPDALRETCRRVWNVPLVDAYSCVELGQLALECPLGGRYHVQSENVLLEVLREDGTPCGSGETGRVVVTALHGFVMPLVRYEVGDYAELGAPCACGRTLPVLERILGRARSTIRLPTGERIWPRYGSNVLGGLFPVRQFRLRQVAPSRLVLEMVLDRALSRSEGEGLRKFVLGTLRYPFELEFVEVSDIPRSPGGKFEDVVCELE